MGRLLGLAREHGARLLLLSPLEREQASLGPLVSVRLAVHRVRDAEGGHEPEGRLALEAEVLKDKSGLLAASHTSGVSAEHEHGGAAEHGITAMASCNGLPWRRAG
jgi:hypothetical protein